jgi:DNA polymerase (family 10)
LNLAAANELGLRVIDALQPFCTKIMVAGSVRRLRAHVNDLDIVLIPAGLDATNLIMERIEQNWDLVAGRQPAPQNVIFRSRKSGFQLDLFFAHAGTSDLISSTPSNWGAILLTRTGSKFHNQQLCQHAIGKGLKYASTRGVMKGDEVIASETEESIYEALGLPWREPTEREELR